MYVERSGDWKSSCPSLAGGLGAERETHLTQNRVSPPPFPPNPLRNLLHISKRSPKVRTQVAALVLRPDTDGRQQVAHELVRHETRHLLN